jgi:hypothetical protein
LKKASLLNEALLQEFISFLKSLELDTDNYLKELQKYCNQSTSHTSTAGHYALVDKSNEPIEKVPAAHENLIQIEANDLNENHE